jgi:hypothetical protein
MHLSSAPLVWLITASALMVSRQGIAQETITAVYKAQEVSFQFRSSNQFFYCNELQQRVARILIAVGARDDINVDVRNCNNNIVPEDTSLETSPRRGETDSWDRRPSATFRKPASGREQSAHVRIRLQMPVEVTPKVLEEIDKDKSRRELLSRVTGNPAAAFNDPVAFAAARQEVTLSQRTMRLQPEDCEVLDQISSQLFRKLGVRVVHKSVNCGSNQMSRIPPQLTAEALLPTGALVPMPDPEKKASPGASDKSVPETTQPPGETPPQ